MKQIGLWIVVSLAAFSVLSCGKQSATNSTESGKVKVAFVTNNVSDFWMIAKAGVKAAEKDFGVKCEFRMPGQGTPAEQKQILEDLIVTGVSGVAVSPVDPANQTDMLNAAAPSMKCTRQNNSIGGIRGAASLTSNI